MFQNFLNYQHSQESVISFIPKQNKKLSTDKVVEVVDSYEDDRIICYEEKTSEIRDIRDDRGWRYLEVKI